MNPSVLHLGFSCLKRCVIFRKQKNCVSTKYKATVKGDKEMHGLQIRAIGSALSFSYLKRCAIFRKQKKLRVNKIQSYRERR
jgi:hypothetical protein